MHYIFDLSISREEMLKFYSGSARSVHARDRGGRRVAFPAQALRRFVGPYGVQGTFRLEVDGQGRLRRVDQLM